MKILFVIPAYIPAWKYGGVACAMHSLAQELVLQGADITVYTTDAGLPNSYDTGQGGACLLDGVKVHYFKHDREAPILSKALVKKVLETIGNFDLLHLAAVWQPLSIEVRRAAVKAGCPYILAPRGSLDAWPVKYKRWKKLLYYMLVERNTIRMASGISFCSQMELEGSSHFARKGQLLCNIPNGLNFAQWKRNAKGARQWRAEVGIPEDVFLILSVGRLHYKKGLELAIRALAPLRERNWHMVLVGNDEDGTGAKLLRQVKDLGIANQVSFFPTVSPLMLPAIYSAGDLFILPSHHENFGNVVLEAVACECPVLVSDQVGVAGELAGTKGVAVRKRDVALWRQALRSAFDGDDEFKAYPGDRNELERRFSIDTCARNMLSYYQKVISAKNVE